MFSAHITSSTAAHSPFSSEVPSSAQTRVNKACDGMSAREVWSGAGSRATALYGAARLRHSLPSCQNSPAEDSPASPPILLLLLHFLLTRSRLHLLRWNGLRLLLLRCLPPSCSRAAPEADVTELSPPLPRKKKTQETTAKDNPRLKTNLKLKIVYFSPPKVYKYFSITCRHFRLTLIPR